jgi:hypothetical protein
MAVTTEQLKFTMQRFDAYINGANTKGAFLLAFNTFLCGGLLTNYKTLTALVGADHVTYLKSAIVILILAGIACLVTVLLAVYPFLKSGNSTIDQYHSLVYFGSVSKFNTGEKYIEALKKQEEAESYADISKQIYQLSISLKKKYTLLKWATVMIFFQLAVVICCVMLILIKGK